MEITGDQEYAQAMRKKRRCIILLALFIMTSLVLTVFVALEFLMPKIESKQTFVNSTKAVSKIIIKSLDLPHYILSHRKGYEHNSHIRLLHRVHEKLEVSNCWLCTRLPQTVVRGLLTYAEPLPANTTALALVSFLNRVKPTAARMLDEMILGPLHLSVMYQNMYVSEDNLLARPQNREHIPYHEMIVSHPEDLSHLYSVCRNSLEEDKVCPTPMNTHLLKQPLLCFTKKGVNLGHTPHCQITLPLTYNASAYFVGRSVYFVCGESAYLWLPPFWDGTCYLALLLPDVMPVRTEDLHLLSGGVSEFHRDRRSLTAKDWEKGFCPMYGITTNSRKIQELSRILESTISASVSGLQALSIEMQAIRLVVLQNTLGLDLILAKEGKLCRVIGISCCTFIPDLTGTVQEIIEKLHVIEKTVKKISNEKGVDLFSLAWLQDIWISWGWTILIGIMAILAAIFLLCLCLHCLPTFCRAVFKHTSVHNTQIMWLTTHAQVPPLGPSRHIPGYGFLPQATIQTPTLDERHLYSVREMTEMEKESLVGRGYVDCNIIYELKD